MKNASRETRSDTTWTWPLLLAAFFQATALMWLIIFLRDFCGPPPFAGRSDNPALMFAALYEIFAVVLIIAALAIRAAGPSAARHP